MNTVHENLVRAVSQVHAGDKPGQVLFRKLRMVVREIMGGIDNTKRKWTRKYLSSRNFQFKKGKEKFKKES